MRYPSAIKQVVLLALFLLQGFAVAQDFPPAPNPPRLVNDLTGTLSAEELGQLEQKLLAYSDSTSTQVSIVLLGSVGVYDISDYAFQLGEQWGIGGKGKDKSRNSHGNVVVNSKQSRGNAVANYMARGIRL